jgi:DNA-binding NarL/FixJ family response regulator
VWFAEKKSKEQGLMNWTQPTEIPGKRELPVCVCDSQPLIVAGLKASLAASGTYVLVGASESLEHATRLALSLAPRIMIVDKGFGAPAVAQWLGKIHEVCPSISVVVWGASMTEAEALRYLRLGARGVVRKTADVGTLLACLENVAMGCTWMEEAFFHEGNRLERQNRLQLTAREQQVLELVEQGLRNKEIASELGIQPGTVKIHLKHIFEKTGVRGRYGLALSGLRERAIPEMAMMSA